ncbi:hypothetical protein LOTGIDRAFT_153394 [Lottia gigantea]|uniref:HECT domain-containing protein n=1 Tax=Lottia gigantea TaxID=225164 RepID=V4AK49_LOTGI|nr:hypothetical protein LOTGIDRAFT_153394 [Lottia gigantea]ESO93921.1 hypothetical protein LOTGIDRAFT_153394 [Lottia gigantea]
MQAAIQASLLETPPTCNSMSSSDVVKKIQGYVNTEKNPTHINVVRGRVLDGASRAIKRSSFDPCAPICLKFMDDVGISEGAVDEGGPKREFFTLAMREISESNMFCGDDGDKFIVPNQTDFRFAIGRLSFMQQHI